MKVRVIRQDEGAARWVRPLPDEFPEFEVEAQDLGSKESAKLVQRAGAGGRDPRIVELLSAGDQITKRSILNWRGEERLVALYEKPLREGGVLKGTDVAMPFSEENKVLFIALQFEEPNPNGPGAVNVSLGDLVLRALRADLEVERKN